MLVPTRKLIAVLVGSFAFSVLIAPTVPEFQAAWPWGAAGLLLGGSWFRWFVRRWWPEAR